MHRTMIRFALCAALFAVSSLCATAQATDKFSLWLSPEPNDFTFRGDFGVTVFDEQDVENEDPIAGTEEWEYQATEYEAQAIIPLWSNGKTELLGEFDFTGIDVDTDVRLPRWDNDPFPDQLIDVGLGLTLRHFCENGWMVGANIRLGSASDKPFESDDEFTGSLTAFLRIPSGEHNAWMFYVDVRNSHANGGFNYIPKPGIGYQFALSNSNWAVVGMPISAVHWEPFDGMFKFDAMYMVPRTVNAKLAYVTPIDGLDLYTSFKTDSKVFWRHDRKDSEDALVMKDNRAALGINWAITENISLDASGGYAWNRRIYEAEKYSQRDKNRVDIDDGAFGALSLELAF